MYKYLTLIKIIGTRIRKWIIIYIHECIFKRKIIIMYLSKFDKNEAYIILRMIYNVIASLSLPNL